MQHCYPRRHRAQSPDRARLQVGRMGRVFGQQIDNRYAARCLVELADDRLRRATRQEDGEPGWRFKIRKSLLGTGQIWQGRVYSRPRGRDFVVVSFFEGETDGFETN